MLYFRTQGLLGFHPSVILARPALSADVAALPISATATPSTAQKVGLCFRFLGILKDLNYEICAKLWTVKGLILPFNF